MYEAIVIGSSAGGVEALKIILQALPVFFQVPVVIVQHQAAGSDLVECLERACAFTLKEAEDKEMIEPNTAYVAPAGYHLLIERDKSFSLSVDPRVNYACPSIDVLFESAADTYGQKLIGIILTGANSDGGVGLGKIKQQGGLAIVQNPETAHIAYMPQAALKMTTVDDVLDVEQIGPWLVNLEARGENHALSARG